MIKINTTNYKGGIRTPITIGGQTICLETSPVTRPKSINFGLYNIFTQDSEEVIFESYVEQKSLQYSKKTLKPGLFSTKPFSNFIQRIGPKSPKWEGPQPDFQEPSFKLTSLNKDFTESSATLSSEERFSEVLNKYLNNEYVDDIEKNEAVVVYRNLNNESVRATTPEKDYFDCFGYTMGGTPDIQKQIELESKTGNPGNILKHGLELDVIFITPMVRFKSINKLNIQNFRVLNNANIEPKKCNNFLASDNYKR